ncbi:MAG: magnesium chelatase ATPase subunit I, partial [Promethearchaeota archaeon]
MRKVQFPFVAILGQERMKLGLILNVIDPQIGGVLLTGQQGTGKSTGVRSLVEVMPKIKIVKNCQFSCDPLSHVDDLCEACRKKKEEGN